MDPPAKKARVTQKFRSDYIISWPFLCPSKLGDSHAHCKTCCSDFSISHGGRDDIKKHISSKKHATHFQLKSQVAPVSSFFKSQSKTEEDLSVIKAEVLFQKFLVEHNVPLAASDHARELFKAMFPDSKVAEKYSCARTKTTAISKCLAEDLSMNLAGHMKTHPFSLATDGSNDNGSDQLYPVVVRYYNSELKKVITELLCIASCDGASTGENIFNLLDKVFQKWGIPWENCLAFGCDNASVMTGIHKGVSAFIKNKNEHTLIQGCPCHLLHIAAKNANNQLSLSVDDILVDIYFHFDKSTKRRQEFKKFQAEAGLCLHKILKHGPTRWLSLSTCVGRLLEQWEALDSYFTKESITTDRIKRIAAFFKNPMSKAYCLFLQNVLPLFVNPNLFLQKEEPVLHLMQESMQNSYVELLVRFVKPKVVSESSNIFEVDHSTKANQKHRQDVMVGKAVRDYLYKLKEGGILTQELETTFFNDVRGFFSSACSYITKSLPLMDKTLAHAQILCVGNRMSQSYNSLEHFVKRFPSMIASSDRDKLEEEFLKYQVDKLTPEILSADRIDVQWHEIGQLMDCQGNYKFRLLSSVMLGICVIPHSNASSERVFSLVRKAKTEFRANMSVEVLSSLMVQRVAMISREEMCYKSTLSKEELSKAKKACFLSKASH